MTTRQPRLGEMEGRDYYFTTVAKFQQMITAGQFLEWAEYAGNFYGTPKQPVLEAIEQGKTVVLEIELQGARQIANNFPEALRIFILPPSIAILEQRIRARDLDDPAAIAKRLERAKQELAAVSEFDWQIVNDDLGEALQKIEAAIFTPMAITHPK
jgi:guanylate kinase